MAGVAVRVDDSEVVALLRRAKAHLQDLTPTMEAIGAAMVTSIDLNFRDQQSPWGTPWTELSEVTKARRRGTPPYVILRDTGILANSIAYKATKKNVTIGTNLNYAATHQFGRADNKFYNTAKGHPAPIPARPFMPITAAGEVDLPEDLKDEILDAIETELDAALGGS